MNELKQKEIKHEQLNPEIFYEGIFDDFFRAISTLHIKNDHFSKLKIYYYKEFLHITN